MFTNAERTKAVMMLKELSEQRTSLYLPALLQIFARFLMRRVLLRT